MRKLLLISTILALGASSAFAAPSVGIYFDPGMSTTDATVEPFVTNKMYIILSGVNAPVEGVEYDLNLPPNVAITNHSYAGGSGFALQGSASSYIVAFGSCELIGDLEGYQPSYIVDEIDYMTITEFNSAPVSLSVCTTCGDNGGATSPRYASCFDTIHELSPTGGSIASQTVPVRSESWGAVKALFSN